MRLNISKGRASTQSSGQLQGLRSAAPRGHGALQRLAAAGPRLRCRGLGAAAALARAHTGTSAMPRLRGRGPRCRLVRGRGLQYPQFRALRVNP